MKKQATGDHIHNSGRVVVVALSLSRLVPSRYLSLSYLLPPLGINRHPPYFLKICVYNKINTKFKKLNKFP